MKSAVPKVLHPVCGRALVAWPIEAAREAGAGRIAVIVSPDRDISGALPDGVETIPQPEANGTGGALLRRRRGRRRVGDRDRPLRRRAARLRRADRRRSSPPTSASGAAATVVTAVLDDPGSYGRVVRSADGTEVEKIVEAKADGDATPRPSSRSRRSTPASTSSTAPALAAALPQLSNDNAQGEYYLPDVAAAAPRRRAAAIVAHVSRRPERDPRRQLPRRPRAGRGRGPPADPRAPHARRGHDRRSRRRPGSRSTSRSPPTSGSSPAAR